MENGFEQMYMQVAGDKAATLAVKISERAYHHAYAMGSMFAKSLAESVSAPERVSDEDAENLLKIAQEITRMGEPIAEMIEEAIRLRPYVSSDAGVDVVDKAIASASTVLDNATNDVDEAVEILRSALSARMKDANANEVPSPR